jgi:hypothetical protein
MKCHRRCSSPTSLTSWLPIVLAAVGAPAPSSSQDFGYCPKALALAKEQMDLSSCGSILSYNCPLATACLGNYDGVGSEVAACGLDQYLYVDGVCVEYTTAATWVPTWSLASVGTYVYLSGDIQGEVSWSVNNQGSCHMSVNRVDCACTLVSCSADDTVQSIQADCTNLGQGTFDYCDKENYGNPGDLLKWILIPEKCTADSATAPTPAGVCGQAPDAPIPPYPAPPGPASIPASPGTPTRVSSGTDLIELAQAQSMWMLAVVGALVSYVLQ